MYDGIERGELNPTEYKCNLYYKNLCPCQTLKTLKSDVGLFLSTPSMSRTQYLSKEAKAPSFYCFWLCNWGLRFSTLWLTEPPPDRTAVTSSFLHFNPLFDSSGQWLQKTRKIMTGTLTAWLFKWPHREPRNAENIIKVLLFYSHGIVKYVQKCQSNRRVFALSKHEKMTFACKDTSNNVIKQQVWICPL